VYDKADDDQVESVSYYTYRHIIELHDDMTSVANKQKSQEEKKKKDKELEDRNSIILRSSALSAMSFESLQDPEEIVKNSSTVRSTNCPTTENNETTPVTKKNEKVKSAYEKQQVNNPRRKFEELSASKIRVMEMKEENKKRQIELAAKKLELKEQEMKQQREFNNMILQQMKMFSKTAKGLNDIGSAFSSDSD